MKREGDVAGILRISIAVLDDGNNLLVFPEPGPTKTGELRKFRSGLGLLMIEAHATVVPVRVKGTMQLWPVGGLPRLSPGKGVSPSIAFGPAITFESLVREKKLSPYSTPDQITACVREIIADM